MKSRQGFISNSSSSSFIVIGDTGVNSVLNPLYYQDGVLHLGSELGETEFGWGPDSLNDIGSRINLCFCAAMYARDPEQARQRIYDVLFNWIPDLYKVEGAPTMEEYNNGDHWYIDHQSVEEMSKMFDDDRQLARFIFDQGSRIELNNDNN
jgi:hypothetical protein